jgi:protein-S-isoprenylcysteine O-methyltransferase Ste14
MSEADLGSRLFENRRWVHPAFVLAALVIGGARPEFRPAGISLLALLLAVRLWTTRYMGGAARVHARKAQQQRVLQTDGPFAWVRNPLYLANSFGLAGACLLFGPPWLAALALVVSLLWYRAIIGWEEQVLSGLYGEPYRDYLARVPRLLPRPPGGASAAPGRELYPWNKVFRRERGALFAVLALIALSLVIASLAPWPWNRGSS